MQALEAPLQASLQGQPVEGLVYVMHFVSPQMPGGGTVQVAVLMSPRGTLAETVRTYEQIANSYQPNPQFEGRQQQVFQAGLQQSQARHQQWMANHQQTMRNSQQAHQQRMAANRAQFESHQQMMQGRWDAADARHAQYMGTLRGGSSSGAARSPIWPRRRSSASCARRARGAGRGPPEPELGCSRVRQNAG